MTESVTFSASSAAAERAPYAPQADRKAGCLLTVAPGGKVAGRKQEGGGRSFTTISATSEVGGSGR